MHHSAYLFDPIEFQGFLANLRRASRQTGSELREAAVRVYNAADSRTLGTLATLQFDQTWLNSSDDADAAVDRWYIVILAGFLQPTPSLSKRTPRGYTVLKYALERLGWDEQDLRELICGRPLHTLVELSGDNWLIAKSVGVDQYGGWLPSKRSAELLERLQAVESLCSSRNTAMIGWLAKLNAPVSEAGIGEMLDSGYLDAIEMLTTAGKAGQALFYVPY